MKKEGIQTRKRKPRNPEGPKRRTSGNSTQMRQQEDQSRMHFDQG